MTFARYAHASLLYYRRTHAAVVLGVAAAVAVLAGSFLVGSSVRASLASLATSRLGLTDVVIGAETPFTEALSDRLEASLSAPVAPLLVLEGTATHQSSGRRASKVAIYGVDTRFFEFHRSRTAAPEGTGLLLSPELARELGGADGDAIVVRVARPTDVPLDSLHGRRDEGGRSIRLASRGTLASEAMGDFALVPGQAAVRAVFVPLARLQRDLALAGRVNTLLVAAPPGRAIAASQVRESLTSTVTAEDLGLTMSVLPEQGAVLVESASGLVSDPVAEAIAGIAQQESFVATPVLTWLANRMSIGDRAVPYSLVTAIGADAAGDAELATLLNAPVAGAPPIVLTEWAAKDIGARPGDALELEYYRWADEGRLVTDRSPFTVAGVLPMRGLAVDRRLSPEYPGITSSTRVSDWDPPFPLDLKLVRQIDEDFWDRYRTAPKAFVPLEAGQRLWKTRYGQLTSLRLRDAAAGPIAGGLLDSRVATVRTAIERGVSPLRAGFNIVNVRSQNLAASTGATDFGAYFSYFSFFLMVSALLLAALFFRLSIEQRLSQIGVLRAAGFSLRAVRRLLLLEGSVVAAAGAAAGVALAIAWAWLMMYGLRTWWVDAVGTTLLELHLDWGALVVGALGGGVAAVLSIFVTVRAISRATPRELLAGTPPVAPASRRRRAAWLAPAAIVLAVVLSGLSAAGLIPAAGGFFGAGALVLIGGLGAFGAWLRADARSRGRSSGQVTRPTITWLGLRNAAWRPGRSLTSAGLVAAAVFLLVSVDSFRKTTSAETGPHTGTGGFSLVAESALPIVHDLASSTGREDAGWIVPGGDSTLAGVDIFSLRLRPGDDASCLNLYQPKQPRLLGVPQRLVEANRFRFARSLAATDAERDNPWRLLGPADAEGIVPAIADQTSLQYVLHAAVGDVITIDADSEKPIRLRFVASLDDSVLQGEIMIAEAAFTQLFPELAGYRTFLVAIEPSSPARTDDVARAIEEGLEPFGLDAQDAARKLESFHRVENTYLSTFQALGGLGLVLGCLGLIAVIARNVLERRRELALLGAAGCTGRDLQRLVAVEHMALVAIGLAIGVASAGVAIAPVVLSRGGAPVQALVWLVPVAIAGLAAAGLATRSVRRLPLVASLRSD